MSVTFISSECLRDIYTSYAFMRLQVLSRQQDVKEIATLNLHTLLHMQNNFISHRIYNLKYTSVHKCFNIDLYV